MAGTLWGQELVFAHLSPCILPKHKYHPGWCLQLSWYWINVLNWTELSWNAKTGPTQERRDWGLEENRVCYHLSCRSRTIPLRGIWVKGFQHHNTLLWLKGAYWGQEGANNLYEIWPGQPATFQEFWPQILVQIKPRNPWEARQLSWANSCETLLWIPGRKFVKFIVPSGRRVSSFVCGSLSTVTETRCN